MSRDASEPGKDDLVRALRSDDASRRNAAAGPLFDDLVEYAKRKIGAQGRQAHLQCESLVLSAVKELDREAAMCDDDEHLRARLQRAVVNTLLDRKRKKRPLAFDGDGASPAHEPSAATPGPGTAVANDEERARDAAQGAWLLELVRTCQLSDSDRALVELYVLKGMGWREIGQALGKTEGSLKTALTRARKKLLPQVFEPLRNVLSSEDWAIATALLIARRKRAEAASALGTTAEAIESRARSHVLPALLRQYGRESGEILARLTGYARR